jgi:hypothetical protein
MHHPPEPTELERQVRKLRLEMRKLRLTVVFCTVAICLSFSVGFSMGFAAVLVLMGILAVAVVVLYMIAGSARLLADGWDAIAMRWQRARWQAERHLPDEKD